MKFNLPAGGVKRPREKSCARNVNAETENGRAVPVQDGKKEAPRALHGEIFRPCLKNVLHYFGAMNYRALGRTGWKISEISFGAWAIGGAWGETSDAESLAALHAALDGGVNFFDTADVYGDGRSERLLAKLKKERTETFYIATKAGRRLPKQTVEGYSRKNLTAWIERSLKNLNTDALDLLQLHCPPTEVFYRPEVFGILDDLVKAGKLRHYGVSVEKVEEALKAIEYPNVQSVQIIFNIFRQRPGDLFFAEARKKKVGILARVPLASGMLSGKISRASKFAKDDHRNFNRHGAAFDRGETFAGVDFETALRAVEELKTLVPKNVSLAQLALRWILEFPAVTCAIPGAKRPGQVTENIAASDLPPLSKATLKKIGALYGREIKPLVHQYW
jgi:aryl-alcohol dehydrogenase-like predicted oxidoreductase